MKKNGMICGSRQRKKPREYWSIEAEFSADKTNCFTSKLHKIDGGDVEIVDLPGEEMTVTIVKEGREATQGVGYLDDGTMVVVEGAAQAVGQMVPVIVSSTLQTSAGKMIFADLPEQEPHRRRSNNR